MSDCSTNSMKPKEPILTNEILQGFADRIAVVVGMPESADCPCGLVDVYHAAQSIAESKHRVDQRCQQLEQVAKDLYDDAWTTMFLKAAADDPSLKKESLERLADSHLQIERNQLAALGVSVDD